MKTFNTAGPIVKKDHYFVDPLKRWDMSEVMGLINNHKYFLLHAPRQTGKTTCLFSLRDKLNEEGKYCAIYTNFEGATAVREDIDQVNSIITSVLLTRVQRLKIDNFDIEKAVSFSKSIEANMRFGEVLAYLAENISKPVVVFIDEADALIGD